MLTRKEFESGIELIVKEFNLKNPKILKNGLDEEELTYSYRADIKSKHESVDLFVDLRGKDEEGNPLIYCSIIYQNEFGLTQFYTHETFQYFPGLIFFSRWISSSVHEFNNKKDKKKIDFIFGDRPVKTFGEAGFSATYLFEILLNGYLVYKPKKILIYKIRHIGHLDNRYFSWAIYFDLRAGLGDHSFWAVFPDCCGLDSGGALHDYNSIVKIINKHTKKVKIKVVEYDLPYDELKFKLEEWLSSEIYQDERYKTFDRDPLITIKLIEALYHHLKNLKRTSNAKLNYLLSNYYEIIEKIYNNYKRKDFGSMFRDNRALLQSIGEKICNLKNLPFREKGSIRDLEDVLTKNKIINNRIGSFLISYHISASKSAHELFPSLEDLDTFEKRAYIRITSLLGFYLIIELIQILRSHFGIEDIEYIDPDIFEKL